jgi:hypothetical protein
MFRSKEERETVRLIIDQKFRLVKDRYFHEAITQQLISAIKFDVVSVLEQLVLEDTIPFEIWRKDKKVFVGQDPNCPQIIGIHLPKSLQKWLDNEES